MRRGAFSLVLAAVVWATTLPLTRAAGTPVDLELILVVDVSRSMDIDEQKLQRDGYVAAITHPDVVAAITQGLHGRIIWPEASDCAPQQFVCNYGEADTAWMTRD